MKTLLIVLVTSAALAQPAITTRGYDNSRSGANTQETILTPNLLLTKGIRRITTIPLVGDARGMEAQPLVLPKVLTPCSEPIGGGVVVTNCLHDVMVLPSMANVVRGVDAKTGAGLWQVTLGVPITGSAQIDMHQINQHWGCLSTGVIDPDTQRLYQVCWISTDGSGTPASGRYFMFVLNVKDGSQVVPPVPAQGTDASMWKQRSSLVMTNVGGVKTVFFAHGSVYETASGFTGGITAFDVATNTIAVDLPISAGIWMGGQGLVADSAGYLYAITGNGDFDPAKGWYGESFIKVKYAPPIPVKNTGLAIVATISIIDQWSPWSDFQRTGQAGVSNKLAGESLPSEAMKPVGSGMDMPMKNVRLKATVNDQGQPITLVYPTMATGAWSDEDWGSAGPSCLFSVGVCIATGKDGIGYPIKTASLGGTTIAAVGTAANYAKLAAPCAWLTMSPGAIPCAPTNSSTLNFFPNGLTAHLHMTPVQFYDPVLKSWTIFAWGENAQLHKWQVGPTGKLAYLMESAEYASADSRGRTPGGMPGGFCSLSSNGNAQGTAILWCSIPYGDANAAIVSGRLLAYDPETLQVLWDSQRWGLPYTFNKFMAPIVYNGQIYLPNYGGGVDVYAP